METTIMVLGLHRKMENRMETTIMVLGLHRKNGK